jgi:hypothetical protein
MTKPFNCDDKTRLVAYLYGETDSDADRDGIEAHLAACRACADEVQDLRGVRAELSQWQPPDADLGFRIVREEEPPARRWWQVPSWAPVALAAGLVLAVGAALANVEVQVANGGVTLRAGWGQAPRAAAAAPAPVTAPAPASVLSPAVTPVASGMSEADVRKVLTEFETRWKSELAAASPHQVTPVVASAENMDRQQILQQVRALVDESERRQQRELALRLADVVQDFDSQRRTDLVRIEQGFGRMETLAGQQAAGQRAITNYLVRASQKQ